MHTRMCARFVCFACTFESQIWPCTYVLMV